MKKKPNDEGKEAFKEEIKTTEEDKAKPFKEEKDYRRRKSESK